MRTRAFSLVELILVMAVLAIITAIVVPAFTHLGKAQSLTTAGNSLLDQFALARGTAVAQNRVVEIRFYKRTEVGGPARFRSFRTMIYDEQVSNAFAQTTMQSFTAGVVLSEEKAFSTLIYPYTDTLPSRDYVNNTPPQKENLSPTEQDVPYQFIRFKPTGGVDVSIETPNNDKWFLTIKNDNDASTDTRPANNYVTIMLDPVSGRTRTYRP